ncbi:MAG: hypothetical protein E7323_01050 [Clostridiales bacterium]|nr:hypothetical protein [Clostridiales bacterium]
MVDLHYDVPMVLLPEQMIANGEVWDAFQEVQIKLAQQGSLIETEFLDQQNAIQTAHTQVMQGLELQNQQLEKQHLFNKVNVGLLGAVLLFAIIQVIITAIQNSKIRKMRETIDRLDEVNRWYASCQEQQEKAQNAIWNKLCAVGDQTVSTSRAIHEVKLMLQERPNPISEKTDDPPPTIPQPPKPPLHTALSQMLIQVAASQSEGWGAKVEAYLANEYHLNIGYYRRRDPSGNLYRGVVELVDDDKAPFFGVATDGRLLLLPNKAYLNALAICAGEFFNGYETASGGISSMNCAVLNKDGDFWRLVSPGSINQ